MRFKPCSAGVRAAGTPTPVLNLLTQAGQGQPWLSSQHCRGLQYLLDIIPVVSFIWLELTLSTEAKSPWLPGHTLDLCYVLTHFLPVVK